MNAVTYSVVPAKAGTSNYSIESKIPAFGGMTVNFSHHRASKLPALMLFLPLAACAAPATAPVRDGGSPTASSNTQVASADQSAPIAQTISGNPMRPGLWDFTRAGGMAANSLGKHCITSAELSDPRSRVNGYLKPEEKQQCETWNVSWQGGSGSYKGVCTLRGNKVSIKGSITASAEYYSDEQQQARDESGFAQAVKDIINGRRIGDC